MKNIVSIIAISICLSTTSFANPYAIINESSLEISSKAFQEITEADESDAIRKCIVAFAMAGDSNDAEELSLYLDSNFSIIMNRLFGSENVDLMDRETYLSKIKTKEWGGDKREVKIEKVTINGTTAFAKVVLKGEKSNMTSLFALVKDSDATWKIIMDMPML